MAARNAVRRLLSGRGARPVLWPAGNRRRCLTSLPQIPGVILTNGEIPEDRLISGVRRWAAASGSLSSGRFDLLQIMESGDDGQLAPRAVCGLLRTRLHLAECASPVKCMAALFYRARDFLNKEFWEDQVRRLCDIAADEFLGGGRGVELMVHHNAPAWAMGLEVGDHRLLAEFERLTVFGPPWPAPWLGARRPSAPPELAAEAKAAEGLLAEALEASGHGCFNQLACDAGGLETGCGDETLRRGHYVLRDAADRPPVCGLLVLAVLPSRLLCGGPWAVEGAETRFGELLDALRRRARRPLASVLADRRDPSFQRLCGDAAPHLPRLRRARRRLGVAVTGAPVGLELEEQATLARAPFLVPWEFVPFHAGRLVLI